MQIPNINRHLLSMYEEPVFKVFKHFSSLGVWSLGVGFCCFSISCSLG